MLALSLEEIKMQFNFKEQTQQLLEERPEKQNSTPKRFKEGSVHGGGVISPADTV